MTCAHCKGVEQMFDDKMARRQLRHYRRKGPAKATRQLLEAVAAGWRRRPHLHRCRRRHRSDPARLHGPGRREGHQRRRIARLPGRGARRSGGPGFRGPDALYRRRFRGAGRRTRAGRHRDPRPRRLLLSGHAGAAGCGRLAHPRHAGAHHSARDPLHPRGRRSGQLHPEASAPLRFASSSTIQTEVEAVLEGHGMSRRHLREGMVWRVMVFRRRTLTLRQG